MSAIRIAGRLAILVFIAGCAGRAAAQARCDCTTIVGACSAEIEAVPGAFDITTSPAQCARVDYFVDGLPFVAVARDGRAVAERTGPNEPDRVVVQSCQICSMAEAAEPGITPALPRADTADEGLSPVVSVDPRYPAQAQREGIEGYVDVEFVVTPAGTVERARVTASSPPGVFDMSALSAVGRWRYMADTERAERTLTERIRFDLDELAFSAPVAAASQAVSTSTVRNICVRERASYNFGDMIDVALFNTCNEPLAVFACGQGAGANTGRWVCVDSERLSQVFVNSSDTRIGDTVQVQTESGPRPFRLTNDFNVTRAPNSEYWWIACGIEDLDCRRDGRRWVGAVDGQLANVNPQVRSQLPVSRSY